MTILTTMRDTWRNTERTMKVNHHSCQVLCYLSENLISSISKARHCKTVPHQPRVRANTPLEKMTPGFRQARPCRMPHLVRRGSGLIARMSVGSPEGGRLGETYPIMPVPYRAVRDCIILSMKSDGVVIHRCSENVARVAHHSLGFTFEYLSARLKICVETKLLWTLQGCMHVFMVMLSGC